jgi:hypothetical protein
MPEITIEPLAVRRRVAARITGQGVTKIDELIATGQIKAVKSGNNLLILVESIKTYLNSLPPAELKLPRHLRRGQRG